MVQSLKEHKDACPNKSWKICRKCNTATESLKEHRKVCVEKKIDIVDQADQANILNNVLINVPVGVPMNVPVNVPVNVPINVPVTQPIKVQIDVPIKNHHPRGRRCHQKRIPLAREELDFFFLIDVSGSMVGSRLDNAKKTFLKIANEILDDHDRISIITFDKTAHFKMQLHPLRRVRHELEGEMNRIYASDGTALYDAAYMAISDIRDKNKKTILFVLTDGEDNASSHTYQQVLDLANSFPNIYLNIIHIDNNSVAINKYADLCKNVRGEYQIINENEIETHFYQFVRITIETITVAY